MGWENTTEMVKKNVRIVTGLKQFILWSKGRTASLDSSIKKLLSPPTFKLKHGNSRCASQ